MKRMTTVLRELMASDKIIAHPGIYDALSAKIAQQVGFKVVAMGGNALGSSLGVTEPLLNLEDLVRVCRYITAAIDVPLKVDADAGFGEPLHVMRTIRELEAAGVAACHLEDQIYPKRAHYHKGIAHTIPVDDMVAKLKAAAAARRDPDFVIIARTDAMLSDGFAEGVRRTNLYLEAGADAAYAFPNTPEEARQAPKEIKGPLCFANSEGLRLRKFRFPLQELEDMGYKFVAYPTGAIQVAAKAMKEMLETLKTTGSTGLSAEEMMATRDYIEETVGFNEMYKLERETVEKG